MKWIDLSEYNLRLVIAEMPSRRRLLVLLSADKYPEEASRLGFSKNEQTGLWIKSGQTFAASEFHREFPKMKVVDDIDLRSIVRRVGKKTPVVTAQADMYDDLDTLPSPK